MVEFIESKLVRLRKEVDEMWELVRTQIDKSGNAVQNLNREDAQTVIVREKHVNAFELKIDSDIEDIIALYNPVAIDLRFVLAMLKINTNLERLGDFAEGIARFVIRCKEPVLDADLLAEGYARDVIRSVQDARKAADLDIADRIALVLTVPAVNVADVEQFKDLIARETLATSFEVKEGAELAVEVAKA